MKRLVNAANITRIRFHDLRHTHASNLISEVVEIVKAEVTYTIETAVKNVKMSGYHEGEMKFSFKDAAKETLNLMKTVYPYLLFGAAVGSVIHEAVPTEWISTYLGGDKWWLVPIATVIGIPFHVRNETIIPITKILIAKGIAFPPIMALMIGSVGASIPEVALLNIIFH